jgi:hypothetical protein
MAAKLRERLSVIKQVAQKFDMHRFDLRKLNDVEVKEQYQVVIAQQAFDSVHRFVCNLSSILYYFFYIVIIIDLSTTLFYIIGHLFRSICISDQAAELFDVRICLGGLVPHA